MHDCAAGKGHQPRSQGLRHQHPLSSVTAPVGPARKPCHSSPAGARAVPQSPASGQSSMPPPAWRPLPTARMSRSPSRQARLWGPTGSKVEPRSSSGHSALSLLSICAAGNWLWAGVC